MFLKELETILLSAHFTTILSLVSLTISMLLAVILRQNLIGLRRLEEGMKFLLIVHSQKQRLCPTNNDLREMKEIREKLQ